MNAYPPCFNDLYVRTTALCNIDILIVMKIRPDLIQYRLPAVIDTFQFASE